MAMEEFNKKKNDLEEQKAEAEAMMDGVEVGRIEQELAQLEANKSTYEAVTAEVVQNATESQVKQITELGGSEDVLSEKINEKNEEMKEIEGILVKKIVYVEGEGADLDGLKKWRSGTEGRITFLKNANKFLLDNNPGPIMLKQVDANNAEIRGLEKTLRKLDGEIQEKIEEPAQAVEIQKEEKFPTPEQEAEYLKRKDWYSRDMENKLKNPENPNNKISKVLAGYPEAMKDTLNSAGYSSFDGDVKKRFGIEKTDLEAALPDLYKKGVVSKEQLSQYIASQSYEGNSINPRKTTELLKSIPIDVLTEASSVPGASMNGVVNEWIQKSGQEIIRLMNDRDSVGDFKDPGVLLSLVSNAGRFQKNKEAIKKPVEEVVNSYLKIGSNISNLRDKKTDSFPVVENLFQAGFGDQAEKLIDAGLVQGSIGAPVLFDLQKKGYFSEDQVKNILLKNKILG